MSETKANTEPVKPGRFLPARWRTTSIIMGLLLVVVIGLLLGLSFSAKNSPTPNPQAGVVSTPQTSPAIITQAEIATKTVAPTSVPNTVVQTVTPTVTTTTAFTSTMTAPPDPDPALTLVAVGDIMLGRDVASVSATAPEGDDYPFALVKNLAGPNDLLFGNLESPLVAPEHLNAIQGNPEEGYRFPGKPSSAAALKRAGFDLVTMANNHAYDFGKVGVEDTLNALKAAGIDSIGAGKQPGAIKYIQRNGLKLAFIAATDVLPQTPDEAAQEISLFKPDEVLKAIREARPQADVVIVALHWGEEYKQVSSQAQRAFVQQASDAGADLILGAHTHVVGEFDVINNHTVVAYSLGNFVFDARYPPTTLDSVALYVNLDKHGVVSAMAVPFKIENDRPRPLKPEERADGLAKLNQLAADCSLCQSNAVIYNGQDWQTVPAMAYVRDNKPDQTINLPLSQTRQVRDLTLDYGGYNTGKAVTNFASQPQTDERFVLQNGMLSVWRPDQAGKWDMIWQTKPGWQVQQYTFGDADEDGRPELMFTMWKNDGKDDAGQYRSHPFVYGWRRDAFRPVWAGSALADPIREFALSDFDHDGHNELVVLEGNYADAWHDPARYVTVLRWNGWGYELLYRGPLGQYSSLVYPGNQPYAFFKGSVTKK